jgi:phage shock protein C
MSNNYSSPRRLYRSRNQRQIAGVCGGLAEYYGMDPTWVRLLFVLLLVLAGSTFWVYLIMWVVVPLEPPYNQ